MTFVALQRIVKTAINSLWRNSWLSVASTLIMIITLIVISVFVSLTIITNKVTDALKDRIDMAAYIDDKVTQDQLYSLLKVISARTDVLSVIYISKDEALKRWQDRNSDNQKIRDVVTAQNNPLPRSLEIKTKNPEDLENIAKMLESQEYSPLIKELSYKKNKDMINRLIKITDFIKTMGVSLSIVFILISILVIYNTIRLTIFARSEEIAIMKLVGATDWYIRGPFVVEGVAYGILATFIASIVSYVAFKLLMPWAQQYLGGFDLGTGFLGVSFYLVVLLQLGVSIILGMGCSVFAVKRHLK